MSFTTLAAAAVLVLPAVALADVAADLQRARDACEKDLKACAAIKPLEAAQAAEDDKRLAAKQAERDAALAEQNAQVAAEIAAWEVREDARKKICGKDYARVRVGMKFSRVQECAEIGVEFELVGQNTRSSLYEIEGGIVRVENGKVAAWVAK